MKYIIILGDGMSDEPIDELGGMTPLQYADTKTLDILSLISEIGMSHTIPEGMNPGSDTANLSVLGYDPRKYYTGRSPLEALSIGVDMKETDIALRLNLVTVSEGDIPYNDRTVIDHSAGEITTKEAEELIKTVSNVLKNDEFAFYTGTSYRHLLIWNKGTVMELVPPHDILGQKAGAYLPKNELLKKMMIKSYDILNNHPINIKRAEEGLNKANSIWFWGAGVKPKLDSFEEKTGKKGAMISAVDLLKGIAAGTGMTNIEVENADGTLNTNYEGKAMAAVDAVLNKGFDFVYIHVEAPDEMSHQGSIVSKVKAIELLDNRLICIVKEEMDKSKEAYKLLIMPDHPTPVKLRTHTSDAVPYLLYDSTKSILRTWNYNEKEALKSNNIEKEGYKLIDKLLNQ